MRLAVCLLRLYPSGNNTHTCSARSPHHDASTHAPTRLASIRRAPTAVSCDTAAVVVLLFAACAALGAGDQYVGSLTRFWPAAWEVPALSAPWLLLPFAAGALQRDWRRAALVGWLATLAALIGYGLMVISPVEHAHFTGQAFAAFARSNRLWFAGATLSGPAFGCLGRWWAASRAWPAAALTAGAVTLEPLVHATAHRVMPVGYVPLGPVTGAEFAIGVALAGWFGWRHARYPRRSEG